MPDCNLCKFNKLKLSFKAGPRPDKLVACKLFSSSRNVAGFSLQPACEKKSTFAKYGFKKIHL